MTNRAKMKTTLAWLVVGVVLLSLAGVLVRAAWPVLFPDVVAVAPLDPDCDLRAGSCTAILPDGAKIGFGIEPHRIPVLEPLRLVVHVDGVEAHSMEVNFAGTDMNMGYNRVVLTQEAEGLWRGEGTLPVCVRDVMNWEATVLVETDEGLKAAPFRFDTYRN